MSQNIIVILLLFLSAAATARPQTRAKAVKIVPLDFSLRHKLPSTSTPWYGWQLFTWKDWIRRPSSGPLLVPMPDGHTPVSVFEARFAAILNQPISRFSENFLHSMKTVRLLDPGAMQTQLMVKDPAGVKPPFVVETVAPLPKTWARLIRLGKKAQILSAKSSDHLIMKSIFGYVTRAQILTNPKIREIIERLDVTGRMPYAIDTQGIVDINEIGEFGSMIMFFYPVSGSQTLLVSDFALAVKNKILKLGFHVGSLNFTGEGVLLGHNPILNTSSGIGAGLPKYTEELFLSMWRGLN